MCKCLCVKSPVCFFREAVVHRRLLQFPHPAAKGSGAAAQTDQQRTGRRRQREHGGEPTLKGLQRNHGHALRGGADPIHPSGSVFTGRVLTGVTNDHKYTYERERERKSTTEAITSVAWISWNPTDSQWLTSVLNVFFKMHLMQKVQNLTRLLCLHTYSGKY